MVLKNRWTHCAMDKGYCASHTTHCIGCKPVHKNGQPESAMSLSPPTSPLAEPGGESLRDSSPAPRPLGCAFFQPRPNHGSKTASRSKERKTNPDTVEPYRNRKVAYPSQRTDR